MLIELSLTLLIAGLAALLAFWTLLIEGAVWAAVLALGTAMLALTKHIRLRRPWLIGTLAGAASGVVFLMLMVVWPLDASAPCHSGVHLHRRPGTSVAWLLPWAVSGLVGIRAALVGQRKPDLGAALVVVARGLPAAGLLYLSTGFPVLGC